ncbi:hypothetical protein BDV19DRAFT_376240 [Aspergillus venezuelensis]
MTEIIQTPLDNKSTPLKVPGLHGLPINMLRAQDQFATGMNDWDGHILTAKELAMLALINTLTDLPDWHRVVFDQQFNQDSHLVVLNTSSSVCKSDMVVSSDLKLQLSKSVNLFSYQAIWQKSESGVVNLVDPSLFPLVYGRTKILDRVQSCGMDEYSWSLCSREGPLVSELPQLAKGDSVWPGVDFTGPPGSTDVQISSYINNLHLTNRKMYSAIKAVISSSIKAQFPEWVKKLPPKEDEGKLSAEEYETICAQVEAYLLEPESKVEVHWHQGLLCTALTKYGHIFVFKHSDPGTAYSYEDWKGGKTGKAIIGPAHYYYVCNTDYELSLFFDANPWLTPYEWMYKPKEEDPDNHQFYTIMLQDDFHEHGLQVIVQIHSIELGPETPSFPGEEWHTKGNGNKYIVANAIYAINSENMSKPQFSFWQRCTKGGPTWSNLPIDMFIKHALWDVKYIRKFFRFENIQYAPACPLQYQDKTKGSHCCFLTLSLVDPTYQLCSTRNVPPQQAGLEEALDLREELVKEHAKKDKGVFKLASTLTFSGFS